MRINVLRALTMAVTMVAATRASAAPPAPTPTAPAPGASLTIPFTIAWSPVTDPAGITAYNWEVSSSSAFTPVVAHGSTNATTTQDTVSGLANGVYFWHVQAVNDALQQGAWSAPQSLTVTGAGPGTPGIATLGPPKGYSTFHPYETMTFTWSAVPDAATYTFEASTDPAFPVCCSMITFDNLSTPTVSFAIGNPEGNYFARVRALSASRISSAPSNVITFSVFFNNPLPPPPNPLSPPNGATLTLPITITWSDVPNPQPSGYTLEIAKDSRFRNLEELDAQLNDPTRTVLSLTSGKKFWRVQSVQGDASPTTAAVTAWSATGSFTVSSAPPTPVSVTSTTSPLASGNTTFLQLQLSGAPTTTTNIALTSSDPIAMPVPAAIAMPANLAWTQFQVQAGQVSASTPVTITATLNGASASGSVTVTPTALKTLTISPPTINGGAQAGAVVMLTGQAPPGGASVALTSDSAAVSPPPSVFVNPGSFSTSFALQTNPVSAATAATITATWNGVSRASTITLIPQPAPASISLNPTSTIGLSGSSFATVAIDSAQSTDTILQVTTSNPSITLMPNSVTVPAGVTRGGFNIFTQPVTTSTDVTISVSGGGVTKSAVLTVTPSAPPPPSLTVASLTVSPTSVIGGTASTGTVTLSGAAPTGGASVTLSSNQPGAASVPPAVTVVSGATSATFPITTFVSAGTTVQLAATLGTSTAFAALAVNPPPASPPPPPPSGAAVLTVTATGRSGERILSNPSGLSVAVGSTGSASFASGTSITLSSTDSRDVIWSGACSSGGSKVKTCTFTLNANATVTANVQ